MVSDMKSGKAAAWSHPLGGFRPVWHLPDTAVRSPFRGPTFVGKTDLPKRNSEFSPTFRLRGFASGV